MKTNKTLENEFRETKVNSEVIYDGKVVKLCKDTVQLPDGNNALREVVRHKGAVCVIPVTENGEVVMVRQYRYAVERVLWEIPAGKLDSTSEIPLEAAKRELREETGAVAQKLEYLGEYLGSPAILDEKIHMYLATGLTFGNRDLDEDEFVETDRVPLEKLVEMVLGGEIPDGKTQAAVLRAAMMLGYVGKNKKRLSESENG